ncbi:MAG TPA: Na+/H+ antiporter NhaC family protein [Anaerovoracaceae bacterium]|nr:Na+/H+ antiporter NhaC family protein [Anaerovoracaceae bacterium]
MELIIGFIVFVAIMLVCLIKGYTMLIALIAGLFIFATVACRKGFSIKEVTRLGVDGVKDAIVVSEVMLLIGFVTAIWRSSGTITFFVYYGIKIITPSTFIVVTFLLCTVLSYALGTSFGVAGTVGVIFIALARSGGVSEIVTAGAIMSGIYFGDRNSPVSSSAILVAAITHTKLYDNVKMMMRTVILPYGISLAVYIVLSILNPIQKVDQNMLDTLQDEFSISWWCIIPALCILILPLLKVEVIKALIASIVTGFIISLAVEKMPLLTVLKTCIFGYEAQESNLGSILNGGGMLSMIEVVCIVALSSSYSGIFAGTNLLADMQSVVQKLMHKIGRFWALTVVGIGTIAIFCNQTIASMMVSDIFKKPYEEDGATREELAMDIESSVIVLSGVVPWAIACSVPLKFMQVGFGAVPLSILIFLIPITYGLTKGHFFPGSTRKK